MNDAAHWRRMLPPRYPPSRPKTSQPTSLESSDDRKDDHKDERKENRKEKGIKKNDVNESVSSLTLSSVGSMTDLKAEKKKPKPKFIHRASQYLVGSLKNPSAPPDPFENPQKDLQYADIDRVVENVYEIIARNPGKAVEAHHGNNLLRIFEAYKEIRDERNVLVQKLKEKNLNSDTTLHILESERTKWKEDEEHYKADVKRLEVLMAMGKTGMAEVTLARTQSLIRGTRRRARMKRSEVTVPELKSESLPSSASSPDTADKIISNPIRPTTPSRNMSAISASLQGHHSYLNFDLVPGAPPTRKDAVPLGQAELFPGFRTSDETDRSGSFISTFTDDDSFDGDLLPDEIEQQELNTQAIEHVAKLIYEARGAVVETTVGFLKQCITGEVKIEEFEQTPVQRKPSPDQSDVSSEDNMPTLSIRKTLANRRGEESMHIATNTRAGRPFSFFAGDDNDSMVDLHSAPIIMTDTHSPFSPMPNLRRSSLIPSPVAEHTLAKPRREDSNSSVITSVQRSPMGEPLSGGGSSGTVSRVGSSHGIVTRSSSMKGPGTPRTPSGPGSMRAPPRTSSLNHKLVNELEKKRNKENSGESQEGGSMVRREVSKLEDGATKKKSMKFT